MGNSLLPYAKPSFNLTQRHWSVNRYDVILVYVSHDPLLSYCSDLLTLNLMLNRRVFVSRITGNEVNCSLIFKVVSRDYLESQNCAKIGELATIFT